MEPKARVSFPEYWRLIRGNANFRRLWIAQMISETGDWMYMIAIYDQLLKLTGGAAKSIGFAFVLRGRSHTDLTAATALITGGAMGVLGFLAAGITTAAVTDDPTRPFPDGLAALAAAAAALRDGTATSDDLARLQRWSVVLKGRGACATLDAATNIAASLLAKFGDQVGQHMTGSCTDCDTAYAALRPFEVNWVEAQ